MKRLALPLVPLVAALLALLLGLLAARAAGAGEPAAVRAPAFAGSFYPDDPARLRAAIEGFLADARPPRGEAPVALVAPHAGYVYSGQIAADAYRQAMGSAYDVVVILGTNHAAAPFDGVSVDASAGLRTPLGVAVADAELARALAAADGALGYRPEAHAREHSIEVQVPFVQVALPRARIVAAVVGRPDLALAERFGRALARALAGRRALIVASSDLSHYPARDAARAADLEVLAALATLDAPAAAAAFARVERAGTRGLVTAACGQGPALAALVAARELGARSGAVVSYANSGDTVAGEAARVVGYGALAWTRGRSAAAPAAPALPPPPGGEAALSAAEHAELLALARSTLERWFRSGTFPLPRPTSERLGRPQGAFVTLLADGRLRGCIGDLAGETPLALSVARMAVAAAFEDRRFSPLQAAELPGLELEISVLTPPRPVAGPQAIRVGTDGVLLARDGRRAVFLPQVAPEQGWSRDQLLGHLCEKAGLTGDCWRRGALLSTFQADVFREKGAS
ncbi:MAG: hypothetical protein H6Q03_1214 [Acidobacteria bacterium]|nr:hypothetical protein [Acidobacteriota bacterium]